MYVYFSWQRIWLELDDTPDLFLAKMVTTLIFHFCFQVSDFKITLVRFQTFSHVFPRFLRKFYFLRICIFVQRCLSSATSTAEERIFVWRFLVFRYLSGFRFQQICISVQLLRRPRRGCCCRKPLRDFFGEIFRFWVFLSLNFLQFL